MKTRTSTSENFKWLDNYFFEQEEPHENISKESESEFKRPESSLEQILLKPVVAPFLIKSISWGTIAVIAGAWLYILGNNYSSFALKYLEKGFGFLGIEAIYAEKVFHIILLLLIIGICYRFLGKNFINYLRASFYLSLSSYTIGKRYFTINTHFPFYAERTIPYDSVRTVVMRKPLILSLFGAGNIIITLKDRSKVYLYSVKKPDCVSKELIDRTCVDHN